MPLRCVALVLSLSLVCSCFAAAGAQRPASTRQSPYVDALIARARNLDLAQKKQWLRLVHYSPRRFGGHESEADGAAFFVAHDGKDDPDRELQATLRAFFAPSADEDEHALCLFPARFAWLDRELGFDHKKLADQKCPKRDEFIRGLDAESVSLVFSSYYLSNAASAFGHTFLRINKRTPEATERRELLDTGINYSATVDTNNALLYAIKGFAGMFQGSFQRMPYYYKVREYNDFESRDLWSYKLNLSAEEVERLVQHIWELGRTHFDYYYLSENCSYHVLGALDAASTRLHLLDELGWPILPANTIKAVVAHKGLVSIVEFRPSLRRQARQRTEPLSRTQLSWLDRLAQAPTSAAPAGLSVDQIAETLDAAIDLFDMRHSDELVRNEETNPAVRTRFELMARRAELGVASKSLEEEVPAVETPHLAHNSKRLGFGTGWRGGDPYLSAHFRLALHDLADSSAGFPKLAQIQFLPTEVRYWAGSQKVQLESLALVNVMNIVPLRRYEKKFSWLLTVGGRRLRDADCPDCFAGGAEFAAGYALATADDDLAVWAMGDAEAMVRPGLDVVGPSRYGIGGRGGVRASLGPDFAVLMETRWLWQPESARRRAWDSWGTVRWLYARNLALSANASYDEFDLELGLSLLGYL